MFKFRQINLSNKYLLPGIKRWILIFSVGIAFIVFGVALLLELRPLTQISNTAWKFIRWIADLVPAQISGPIILGFGALIVIAATISTLKTVIDITIREAPSLSGKNPSQSVLQALERASRRGHGPKIVAIGGGTGLSTLLRGIKNYSNNITAIVTVGDDGGSSGRLREELRVVPPGDIRNCIVALSDEEEVTTSLFQYRFTEGSLKGHSLGNLFLAALCDISGDMAKATLVATRILRTVGKVLPSAAEGIHLKAELEDGTIIEGESKIPESEGRIKRVYSNGLPPALPESIEAIKDADLIILGPGSLYTSIIPNILFPEIVNAIKQSKAKVLYVCNLVQDRETRNYIASDFLKTIEQHANSKIVDAILVNSPESWNLEKGKPIQINQAEIISQGIEVVIRARLQEPNGRHSPLRLARSIMQWFNMKNSGKENHQQIASISQTSPVLDNTLT